MHNLAISGTASEKNLDNVTECFVSGEHDIICLFSE